MAVNMDALSKLPAAQVREMREAFQILDQDSDGAVNREDVSEMLKSLGRVIDVWGIDAEFLQDLTPAQDR